MPTIFWSDLIINARYSNAKISRNVPDYGSRYDAENNEGDLNLKWKFTPNQNILVGAKYNANYKTNTILKGDQVLIAWAIMSTSI